MGSKNSSAAKFLWVGAGLVTLACTAIFSLNALCIPIALHMVKASQGTPTTPTAMGDFIMFKPLSYFIVMHVSQKCSADHIDSETGAWVSDENGAVQLLTYLYLDDAQPNPLDSVSLKSMLVDRLKHCSPDGKRKFASLTPLQQSILGGKLDPTKLLLDAGANVNLTLDAPGKWQHGMNALQFAKGVQHAKSISSDQRREIEQIIVLLELRMAH
jgi:hypothetical protein